MKNKKIIGVTAVSLVLGSTIITANASAAGSGARTRVRESIGISKEDFQAEKTAIENGDFAAWKTAIEKHGNPKILETINESNFAKYAEAFKLRESGDMDGAKKIMEDLGLKEPGRKGGFENGFSEENRAALESAIKNSDYDAWKTVIGKIPGEKATDLVTEEKFNVIVQAYKLKENGDVNGAMALLKDAKIPAGMFMGGEQGQNGEERIDKASEEALMQTYQDKDYSAWKALMEKRGGKILNVINADNFSQFAEAKILQSEGKNEEAKTILKELGLPFQDRGVKPEKSFDKSKTN